MRANELANQILAKEPIGCTYRQMEFLRDLIGQETSPGAAKAAHSKHLKKVAGAVRREITRAETEVRNGKSQLKEVLAELRGVENGKD